MSYREYFNIDPEYFPQVDKKAYRRKAGSLEKILAASHLCTTAQGHGGCFGTEAEAVYVGGRCLRYR